MRTLLSNLILPLPVFWILIFFSYWFYRKKNKKIARILLISSLFFLLMVSTPFLPNQLVKNLESKYATIETKKLTADSNFHILVLGAGHTNDKRFPVNNQLSTHALARLVEGVRIANELDGSILITSGWKGKREDIPQADVMAKTALILGVDSSRIRKQTLPKNTWMEATEYKRLFDDSATLVIVTNAIHMPRAMYLFRKAGLHPIAAPTNHLVKKGEKINPLFWMPSSGNITKVESAIHEYVGLFWYKMGGE